MFQAKFCKENRNKHRRFNNLLRKSCHLWDTARWRNMVQPDRPQMKIRRVRIAC